MVIHNKPSTKEMSKLWKVCSNIMIDNYKESIEGSSNLRDAYYIIRQHLEDDYLNKGIIITQELYDVYMKEDDVYSYLNQAVWIRVERKGYPRPDAKPIGSVYWNGSSYTPDNIQGISEEQCRGFIYAEKEGVAVKLKELSKYGWAIVTAQGQSTRQIRKDLKATGKICLVISDYDLAGKEIMESIKYKTNRTTHLDINLGDKAEHLIFSDEQIDFLSTQFDIPKQQCLKKDLKKWKKNWRVELSAFTQIKIPNGSSILEFTKAEMKRKGYKISPLPISKTDLFKSKTKILIQDEIINIINSVLENYEIRGESCGCSIETEKGKIEKNKEVRKVIEDVVENLKENVDWISEKDYENVTLSNIPPRWKKRSKDK